MQGYSSAISCCLIGFMAAAVPSQSLQIGLELISLARLLLKIKEGVGGDQSQIGTFVTFWAIYVCYILTDLSSVCSEFTTANFTANFIHP